MKTKSFPSIVKFCALCFLYSAFRVTCLSNSSSSVGVGLELSLENVTEGFEINTENQYDQSLVDIYNITNLESLRFATVCETPNNEPGYCIELSKCNILSKDKKKKKAAAFLEASKCGPANEDPQDPKVCCGKYNNFRNISTHIADDSSVFPKKCGTQKRIFRSRIVGGKEAFLGEYPWMVRIVHKNNHGYKTYGCSGFMIHTKYVVTAAHCIKSNVSTIRGKPYSVVIGEHNIETKIDCLRGGTLCADPPQVSRINQVVVHPGYSVNSKDHHNDIALIYLNKAAKLSDYVQPICLLTDPNEEVTQYYLSGWGKTESKESSPVKLKVELNPFDKEECKEKFGMLKLEIDDTQVCAGGEKLKDGCSGDSGGPLMMSENGTTYFAAGLVSYGIGCGLSGWPGVYTSIPSFVEWIKNEILKISLNDRMSKPKKQRKKKMKQANVVNMTSV